MSEIVDKKSAKPPAGKSVPVEIGPVEGDLADEFTPEEITRLLRVKREIAEGRYTDITPEHRRLLFVEWLVEHGKLKP